MQLKNIPFGATLLITTNVGVVYFENQFIKHEILQMFKMINIS